MQQVGCAFSSSVPKILLGLEWLAEALSVHEFRADEKSERAMESRFLHCNVRFGYKNYLVGPKIWP